MKKLIMVAVISLFLVSCTTTAWWKPDTPWKEAKEDIWRCYEEARDAFKKGDISWEKDAKSHIDACMKRKGYVLRDRNEVYPEIYKREINRY